MRAVEDANNAAFGAGCGCARSGTAAPLNPRNDAVAVHRIAGGIAADEQIAVHLRNGFLRNDESVAVPVRDEAAGNQLGIAAGRRRSAGRAGRLRQVLRMLRGTRRFSAGQLVAAAGKLLYLALALQFGQHLLQGAARGMAQLECLGYRTHTGRRLRPGEVRHNIRDSYFISARHIRTGRRGFRPNRPYPFRYAATSPRIAARVPTLSDLCAGTVTWWACPFAEEVKR